MVDQSFYKLKFKRDEGDWKLKTDKHGIVRPIYEVMTEDDVFAGYFIGYPTSLNWEDEIVLYRDIDEVMELYFRVS